MERVGEVLGERVEANYAQMLTLDLLRKGFSFEEVPIHYRLREHGASFVDWRYPAKVLPAIWRELRAP